MMVFNSYLCLFISQFAKHHLQLTASVGNSSNKICGNAGIFMLIVTISHSFNDSEI